MTLEGLEGGTIRFESGKVEIPEMNPGARKLQRKTINEIPFWAIASKECVKAAVNAVRTLTSKDNEWNMVRGARTPVNAIFVPEHDDCNELEPKDVTLHREMIGMLCWATELGRVDILRKISILSQCQASSRANHVKQLLWLPSHLENGHKSSLCMEPNLPTIDKSRFPHDCNSLREWPAAALEGIRQLKKKGLWTMCLKSEAKDEQIIPRAWVF